MDAIKNISPKELAPGIKGYYTHGNQITFGLVELEAGSSVPLHSHVHEQITYILEGQLDMIIADQPCSLSNGMYHVIPSNTFHSAFAKTNCKVIDVFNPVRQDYQTAVPVEWNSIDC